MAVERSEALETELAEAKATAEQRQAALQAKLEEAAARAEAAEKRAADLDASLAKSSASDSAALSAVRTELSERCHAVTKLERELKEIRAAKEMADDQSSTLSDDLKACQAELQTTLEEAIDTRINLDALGQELQALKDATESTDADAKSQAEGGGGGGGKDAAAVAGLSAELAATKQSLIEAVECGEAAADALSELRLLSKGPWQVGDSCQIEMAAEATASPSPEDATGHGPDKDSAADHVKDGGSSKGRACYTGTIRFLGEAAICGGNDLDQAAAAALSTWVGVELTAPVGRNDGSVRGVRYFTCPPQHGLLVRPERLLLPPLATTTVAAAAGGGGGGATDPLAASSFSDTKEVGQLRDQIASMAEDLKRATQSRRQADSARKHLEASLSTAQAEAESVRAAAEEERSGRGKAEARAVTLSQELARLSEEVKRLQGYLSSKRGGGGASGPAAEKRAAAMTLEEREAVRKNKTLSCLLLYTKRSIYQDRLTTNIVKS